jgi:hypothetical protein
MNKREAFKQITSIQRCLESAVQNEQPSCKDVAMNKLCILVKQAPPSIAYELGCIQSVIEESECSSDINRASCRLSRLME